MGEVENASRPILRARRSHGCRTVEKHDEFAPCHTSYHRQTTLSRGGSSRALHEIGTPIAPGAASVGGRATSLYRSLKCSRPQLRPPAWSNSSNVDQEGSAGRVLPQRDHSTLWPHRRICQSAAFAIRAVRI